MSAVPFSTMWIGFICLAELRSYELHLQLKLTQYQPRGSVIIFIIILPDPRENPVVFVLSHHSLKILLKIIIFSQMNIYDEFYAIASPLSWTSCGCRVSSTEAGGIII